MITTQTIEQRVTHTEAEVSSKNTVNLHFHPIVEIQPIVFGLIGAVGMAGIGFWRRRDR